MVYESVLGPEEKKLYSKLFCEKLPGNSAQKNSEDPTILQ